MINTNGTSEKLCVVLQNCMVAQFRYQLYLNKRAEELGEQKDALHGRQHERWVAKEIKIEDKQRDRWSKSLSSKAEVKL